MMKTFRVPRARLMTIDRLIGFNQTITTGSSGPGTETIVNAEHTGDEVISFDVDGSHLGRVKVFSSLAPRIGTSAFSEWRVRMEPVDERARALLQTLPVGPPDLP